MSTSNLPQYSDSFVGHAPKLVDVHTANTSPQITDEAHTDSPLLSEALHLEGGISHTGHTPHGEPSYGARRNRLTRKQRDALLSSITQNYQDGLPLTAIMLKHKLSRTQVKDFLAELFQSGAITPKVPQFEVIAVTGTIKKMLAIKECWKWIKLEKAHDKRSYSLTEYTDG